MHRWPSRTAIFLNGPTRRLKSLTPYMVTLVCSERGRAVRLGRWARCCGAGRRAEVTVSDDISPHPVDRRSVQRDRSMVHHGGCRLHCVLFTRWQSSHAPVAVLYKHGTIEPRSAPSGIRPPPVKNDGNSLHEFLRNVICWYSFRENLCTVFIYGKSTHIFVWGIILSTT